MSFPAMSVYEFDFLKEEEDVIEYWKSSSVYIICQRPVLYFDDIIFDQGVIHTKIRQRGDSNDLSLKIFIDSDNFSWLESDGCWVNLHFYDQDPIKQPPYKNVAGLKLLNNNHEFMFWFTPEKLIYEYLHGRISAKIDGNIHDFLTYNVHYIGQAQDQNIWERLSRHEKLSKILTREFPFIDGEFNPFELSIILLKLEECSEANALLPIGPEDEIVNSKGKQLNELEVYQAFSGKNLEDIKKFVVNDFEAYLINFFQPKYNEILYKKYPSIATGLKSIGYDKIQHNYMLFANLKAEEATYSITISPIYS